MTFSKTDVKITREQALSTLTNMDDKRFKIFFTNSLPLRTQLLIRSGLVAWQDVCPEYYMAINQ